ALAQQAVESRAAGAVPHLPENVRRARRFRDIVASKSGQGFLLGHGLHPSPPVRDSPLTLVMDWGTIGPRGPHPAIFEPGGLYTPGDSEVQGVSLLNERTGRDRAHCRGPRARELRGERGTASPDLAQLRLRR